MLLTIVAHKSAIAVIILLEIVHYFSVFFDNSVTSSCYCDNCNYDILLVLISFLVTALARLYLAVSVDIVLG